MTRHEDFRDDLFYRLNVIPIRLPPLRERREDLPLLIEHFLEENRLKSGKNIGGIGNEAMERLLTYHWPGNVRELINALEYAFVVCRDDHIGVAHLPEAVAASRQSRQQNPLPRKKKPKQETEHVLQAIREAEGKKGEAARLLGISRQALWKKMKKLGIEIEYTPGKERNPQK
jgi:DNA-binding NtrC family response regulator